MKKIFSILMIIAMVISLAGCNKSDEVVVETESIINRLETTTDDVNVAVEGDFHEDDILTAEKVIEEEDILGLDISLQSDVKNNDYLVEISNIETSDNTVVHVIENNEPTTVDAHIHDSSVDYSHTNVTPVVVDNTGTNVNTNVENNTETTNKNNKVTEAITKTSAKSTENKENNTKEEITWSDWTETSRKTVRVATCTENGEEVITYTRTSSNGQTQTKTETKTTTKNSANHVATEVRNKKEATTTSTGYTGDTYCTACNKKISSGTTIAKLPANNTPSNPGTPSQPSNPSTPNQPSQPSQPSTPTVHTHSFGSWTTTKNATCEGTGTKTRTCSCGHKETQTINAFGHNYSKTTVAPTTNAKGYDLFTCTRCSHSYKDNYTDKIAAPHTHSYGNWALDGSKQYRTCSCGHKETKDAGKKWIVDVPAKDAEYVEIPIEVDYSVRWVTYTTNPQNHNDEASWITKEFIIGYDSTIEEYNAFSKTCQQNNTYITGGYYITYIQTGVEKVLTSPAQEEQGHWEYYIQ